MKTHMNNVQSQTLKNDIVAQTMFINHQQSLHSKIKPSVVTKRKQQIKISKNNKLELNQNPKEHVLKLYNNLQKTNYKSTLDNKTPLCYQNGKKILKDKTKNNKQTKFQQMEHQRQLTNLKNRIQNCKSLQQRKKDNFDPITNPVYFIKNQNKAESITIQSYCKKILQKNRPKSGVVKQKKNSVYIQTGTMKSPSMLQVYEQKQHSYGNVNVMNLSKQTKNRPKTANIGKENSTQTDLPGGTFKQIFNYILKNKIYRDSDIKVLYVRLCYKYGQQNIQDIWEQVMDQLER